MARKFKHKNGTWWADVRINGKRVRKSLETKNAKEADDKFKALLRDDAADRWGIGVKDCTPDEFWEAYTEYATLHLSAATLERNGYVFEQFKAALAPDTLGTIKAQDVPRFQRYLKGIGQSDGTINDNCRRMRTLYGRARKLDLYTGVNPFDGYDKLGGEDDEDAAPRYLTREQAAALLQFAEGWSRDQHLFCALCLYAGLRTAEAVNAQWGWVGFEQSVIVVTSTGTWRTKTRRTRSVPLHSTLRAILERYRPEGAALDSYVIAPGTEQGKWRLRWSPKRGFENSVKLAGLGTIEKIDGKDVFKPWCSPHTLRHTFCTWLAQSGVSLFKIQKWAGHSNPRTTMVYAHGGAHDDEIEKL